MPRSAEFASEEFTVAPWTYMVEVGDDEDVRKLIHFAVHVDSGKTVDIDWNPWSRMTGEQFRLMMLMGFPKKPDGHPWTADRIELEYWRRIGPVLLRRNTPNNCGDLILQAFEDECI